MLNETARAWLQERAIDPEMAEAFEISSVRRNDGGEWLAFPYSREGKTVTRKYRRIDEKAFSQDAGAPFKLCWNEDALVLDGPVILTEGEMDALALLQCGYERVLSLPDGAPAKEVVDDDSDKWSYIPDLLKRIGDEREIIIAADGDQNGANLLGYISKRLGKARCKYLRYPDGTKDANDVLRKQGADALKSLVETAPWVSVSGVVKLKDMPPVKEQPVYKATLGGKESEFDNHVSIMRGHVSVWTGVPNHGKSKLVNAVCMELLRHHKWKFGVGCFEDDPQLDYRRDVATYIANKPAAELNDEDWSKADAKIDEHFAFFVEEELGERMTLDWLLEKMEVAVVRYGVDMIVIDPWSKLDHTRNRQESENDYIGRALNDLKRFARSFDVHIAIVAHPRKVEKKADGTYQCPGGYDISGSAHWNNMVDLGVTAYRAQDTDGTFIAQVAVWKVKRHAIMGTPGVVQLKLDHRTGRYRNHYIQHEDAA